MNILREILSVKKEEAARLRKDYSLSRFADSPFYSLPALSLKDALKRDDRISLIAEIKKGSPSKGIIRNDFNHLKIAETYFNCNAEAVSVLTDKNFFSGSIEYLKDIALFKPVPLLRKDFIIDEYQVYESKSYGADAILLICEALSTGQIKELTHCASECGLEVLLELHSVEMLDKIDLSLNEMIGINNRNLETFHTDIAVTLRIASLLPGNCIKVSESGLGDRKDFKLLKENEVNAVLIGESFMIEKEIGEKVKLVKEWCSYES